ncbi:SH3-like domain-containing protein [Nitrosomonas sp. Nm51]|uniref:SH3 domain-containing protein n=1 Tax=Nitrosomonas sp. Nm51 TaxID=133720 RepID=UPI0008D7F2A7|nr:SH3 domain-containing protein [Nitrosomonas sp. Nm51]SEQ85746.1 SH3-like domain-containing protein [Nitrosomonas sp. Nm51]
MSYFQHISYILQAGKQACLHGAWANVLLAGVLCVAPSLVKADMDFFSTAENVTIMYDAPSVKSGKLFVAGANLPVEVVVNVEGWVKVRDSSGSLAWIEKRNLKKQRFVIVTVPMADIYHKTDEGAELVFQAQQHVVLEWLDSSIPGWVRVRHQDGQSGFVKASQVWGS